MKDAPVWLVLLTILAGLFVVGVLGAVSIEYPGLQAFLIFCHLWWNHDSKKAPRK